MRGAVLGIYNGRGVVIAPDQRRLEFSMAEWRSPGSPTPGQVVDYVEENGEARAVFLAPPEPSSASASSATATSEPMTLAIIALACLALGLVIPLLPTIAALIAGAIAAGQARAAGDNSALVMARVAWIGAVVMLLLGALAMLAVLSLFGLWGAAYIWN